MRLIWSETMRKKETIITFRPTDKTKIYLEQLGFMDGRTGRTRKGAVSLSEFINYCIEEIVRNGSHARQNVPDTHQIESAYLEFLRKEIQRDILKKTEDLQNIAKKIKELSLDGKTTR